MKKKIKVYVCCALTYTSEDFKQEIETFKDYLRKTGKFEVLEFVGLVNGTAIDVYKHDIHNCVKEADLIIAECSYPSIGLGWELGTAVEKHQKHVLAVARAKVSRLVIGAECEKNPNYSFKFYSSPEDLLMYVVRKTNRLQESLV